MLVTIESRYTGDSDPFNGNFSTLDLQYDTVEQHLEDMVYFINQKTAEWGLSAVKARWILIGSLFDGAYATWFRSRYPALSYGVIAISPYLVAQPANTGYDKAYQRYLGDKCSDAVHDAFATLESVYTTYSEVQKATYQKTCGCDFNMELGDAEFFYTISVALMSQLGWNTNATCDNITSVRHESSTAKLTNLAALFKDQVFSGLPCSGWDIARDTAQQHFRSTFYLQCSTLGQFEASADTSRSLMPTAVNITWFNRLCPHLYNNALHGVPDYNLFNSEFGGANPSGCNKVFVRSENDAYAQIGATSGVAGDVFVDMHCSDPLLTLSLLDAPSPTITPREKCLNDGRQAVLSKLDSWRTQNTACPESRNSSSDDDDDDDSKTAIIVGVVVGIGAGVIGLALGVIITIYFGRRIYFAHKRQSWETLN
jgi:hypothetical protein